VSIVFFDLESSGLNVAFDQILQFAAIRTDDDLNEIGRFEVRSRLLPYLIPAPGALRVTGLTIDDLLNAEHPSHYEMVCRIQQALAEWCPSIFLGYNSLRFDEEFLRAAFFQCLHPPYATNTGGSSRADVLALVQTAALLHPDALAVPVNEKGKPTFKLDRLAPANGLAHLNAHDALADVEATIHMCRLVRDRCPEVWRRMREFSRKEAVSDFVGEHDAFVLIEPSRQASFVVTALGSNPDQGNLTYCWDLTVDPRPFGEMSDDELVKALAKSGSPVRRMKKNAAPSLCPLGEAPAHLLAEDAGLFEKRGQWVRQQSAFVRRVISTMTNAEKEYPLSEHVERQIYNGFWSSADKRRAERFHVAEWPERARIAEELEDARLRWLARRIIWVERPDLCSEHHAGEFARLKAKRLLASKDECGGWNTLTRAADELGAMMDNLPPDRVEAFLKLRDYIGQRQAECQREVEAL
jgi:exodeoxyribonuclease-1